MNNQNNQDVPTNQLAQEQNPTNLPHGLDMPIRSYASHNLYDFNPGIAYPLFGEYARFETKPVMLQMIQNARQFGGRTCEDPHDHIKNFYSIYALFNMAKISWDELFFALFSVTLHDEPKR